MMPPEGPQRGAANPAISCRGLTKRYGTGDALVTALRGVDLDVERGEVLMLMGPSGCGKTTLLSILATLLAADEGTCVLLGEPISTGADRRAHLRASTLGFVFQSFNLLPALTAIENVAIPLTLAGMGREALSRAHEALVSVGLNSKIGTLPRQLSGGQQQRVAIARAIVHRPQILLCDEPTSALDHDTGQSVMETLCAAARAQNAAVVIVTHDARITHFADRIAYMEDGRLFEGDGAVARP
ncbi:MAG TPA: ABC transporter ATP-binding protein [Acetobacteraceae bacterium]|nr:ABC transporter ATP-binding protein [Acetobacteraceae bacterium]